MNTQHTPGLYGGRYFDSAERAALQFQYEANLRASNSRNARFSAAHRASFQRDAAHLYASARAALSGAGYSIASEAA